MLERGVRDRGSRVAKRGRFICGGAGFFLASCHVSIHASLFSFATNVTKHRSLNQID